MSYTNAFFGILYIYISISRMRFVNPVNNVIMIDRVEVKSGGCSELGKYTLYIHLWQMNNK